MKLNGVSKSGNENSTSLASAITQDEDSSVSLLSTDVPSPFISMEVCATRDGTAHLLMTWNAELLDDCSMYKIYRIISKSDPTDSDWADEWYIDDDPDSIIEGLGVCYYKKISVDEGDLYEEWIDADTYAGYYVSYLFIYNIPELYYGYFQYYNYQITNYCIADSPSISYNQDSNTFTIGTSMTGRRVIEFHRTDLSYGYPTSITSENTLNEMLLTSIIDEEWSASDFYLGYYYANDNVLRRWAEGTYSVGVNFLDSTNKSKISSAINSALSEINSVLNDYGVYFERSSSATSGDITITVDTEYNLFDIDLDDGYAQGGEWNVDVDSNGYITSATVLLANDFFDSIPYNTYEQVALEELTQAMGAGYDQYEYTSDTLHIDFNYLNKPDYLTTNDKNILRLLYSDTVSVGDNCTAVSKALNIPKGVYLPSSSKTDTTLSVQGAAFLDADASYAVRVFIVNSSGEISYTSGWINITTPDFTRPADWAWWTDIATGNTVPFSDNAFHPVTASEWNAFTSRINEFREYKGLSDYSFTTVNTGTTFTAKIYNEAVAAIQGISGYGTYLSTVTAGTTNALDASLYESLRDELNAIP